MALQQKFEEVDIYWDNDVPFVCKQNRPKNDEISSHHPLPL
jgi:hypothetical protein